MNEQGQSPMLIVFLGALVGLVVVAVRRAALVTHLSRRHLTALDRIILYPCGIIAVALFVSYLLGRSIG